MMNRLNKGSLLAGILAVFCLALLASTGLAQTTDTWGWWRWFNLTNAVRGLGNSIQRQNYYPSPLFYLTITDLENRAEEARHRLAMNQWQLELDYGAARRNLERQLEAALSEIRAERERLEAERRHAEPSPARWERTIAELDLMYDKPADPAWGRELTPWENVEVEHLVEILRVKTTQYGKLFDEVLMRRVIQYVMRIYPPRYGTDK